MSRINYRKNLVYIVLILIVIGTFSTEVSAVLINYGYISATIPIEDRTSYDFEEAADTWYNTPTPANIYGVPGSYTHSWIIDGQYATTWQGLYTCISREYVLWGRATKFSIKLNRSYLVNCTYNERVWTMIHEIGHALSQGDNPSNNSTPNASVMNYGCDRQNYLPRQYDVDGVNEAY